MAVVCPVGQPAGATPSFGSPVVVFQGNASEPQIATGPGGTVYIDAPDGLLSTLPTSPSYLFRSDNGGSSWVTTPPGLRVLFPGGGDSDVSVDPSTGALYMTDLYLAESTGSVSHDGGQSWMSSPIQGPPLQDRPWVASAGDGVVYQAVHQVPLGLVVSRSFDGGITYPLTTVAATVADQTGCVCPSGNLIVRANPGLLGTTDDVGLVYSTSSGGVNFARSANGGTSFTQVAVAPAGSAVTSSAFPVVADAGGGHLDAVWLAVGASSDQVYISNSADWGASWSTPRALVSGGTSAYPWIAVNGSTAVVSLYHTATVTTPDAALSTTQWQESALISSDGGATFSPLVAADPTPAKVGPICTAGAACSGDRELGDFQSAAVDSSDHVELAYVNATSSATSTQIRFVRSS